MCADARDCSVQYKCVVALVQRHGTYSTRISVTSAVGFYMLWGNVVAVALSLLTYATIHWRERFPHGVTVRTFAIGLWVGVTVCALARRRPLRHRLCVSTLRVGRMLHFGGRRCQSLRLLRISSDDTATVERRDCASCWRRGSDPDRHPHPAPDRSAQLSITTVHRSA